MTTRLRFIPENAIRWDGDNVDGKVAVVGVTNRCTQGRFLLTPSERTNSLIRGVIGRAQELLQFDIYNYQVLSNHFDLIIGVRDAEHQARILNFINCNISREVGRPEVNDWEGPMFEGRAHAIVAMNEEDLIDRFRYVLAHGPKENLVKRCTQWPGVHAAKALCSGRNDTGAWVDRSALWRLRRLSSDRKKKPTRRANEGSVTTMYEIKLSKLPCWAGLSDAEYCERVKEMCSEIEEEAEVAREFTGETVLGAKAVLRRDPHFRPESRKRGAAPLVYAKAKGTRTWFREQYKRFCEAYRVAHRTLHERIKHARKQPKFPVGGVPPAWRFAVP